MFILEKPYVSDYLKNTAADSTIPVLHTEFSQELELKETTKWFDNDEAITYFNSAENPRLYTNSENAIEWIIKHLGHTTLPEKINWFKDKAAFRKLTQHLFPEVFFKTILPEELDSIQIESLKTPFVIKPAVGFLSLAVYPVHTPSDWPMVKTKLKAELASIKSLFPAEVLNSTKLLIEGYIAGTEFAFDAYYDEKGVPSILNILKHEFASANDVSDRVYLTSKEVMQTYLPPFTAFLENLGKLADLKNFPLHVEVRVDEKGKLLPIEVNPLRFGGFCTTADLTPYAWGFNPYLAFFQNYKPDWNSILEKKDSKLYGLIVLDNSTGIEGKKIVSFNYKELLTRFEKPLELRPMNYKEYPVFGFLFTETREENYQELTAILQSDLKEFVSQ